MAIFRILATPLGILMNFMYSFIGNYGWTLVLFTVLVRLLMFPLTLKQQKSTARTSAYQPMIQEIQKKWANDKNRQTQELQKFYEENNIKMTAGCLPSIVNMLVIFSIISLIQMPVTYIIRMPAEQIENATAIVAAYHEEIDDKNATQDYTLQSIMIRDMEQNPEIFTTGEVPDPKTGEIVKMEPVEEEWVTKVGEFDFKFLGIDMSVKPTLAWNIYLIFPVLSVITMLLSQVVIMKFSGQQMQQGQNSMLIMSLVMGVMFAFYAFRVPGGFSLYYTISNIVMTLQQLLVKKIYDPAKVREEINKEIEERKKEKKAKKVVKVKERDGSVQEKELSEAEIARLRLAKARELDAQRYLEEENSKAKDIPQDDDVEDDAPDAQETEKAAEAVAAEATEKEEKAEQQIPEKKEEYKPGRRKKAKQKKEGVSFAEREMHSEKNVSQEEV